MIKVSIIVPCYNSDKYLPFCLQSLIDQKYGGNYEIIVVDDGSTDNSYEVARRFAKIDTTIKVYRKDNGGVSSARNYGLGKAKGEYVLFVDSDDWVDNDFIVTLVGKLPASTLRVCGYLEKYPNNEKQRIYKGALEKKNFLIKAVIDERIGGFCCNKVYHRKIINDNKLRFDEELKVGEDSEFNFRYFQYIEDVEYVQTSPYKYRQHSESAVHSGDKNLSREIIKTIEKMRLSSNGNKTYDTAIDYMDLWERVKFDMRIKMKVLLRFVLDGRISLIKRIKILIKILLMPIYLKYRESKGYR